MKEDDVELEMREHDREKEGEIEDGVELTGLDEEEEVVPDPASFALYPGGKN